MWPRIVGCVVGLVAMMTLSTSALCALGLIAAMLWVRVRRDRWLDAIPVAAHTRDAKMAHRSGADAAARKSDRS